MIESLVKELLSLAPQESAKQINRLMDEFREGRDASEIAQLLHSTDAQVVGIGAWFVNELSVVLLSDLRPSLVPQWG